MVTFFSIASEEKDFCRYPKTMSHLEMMHTPHQRQAVKDLLLSRITTDALKDKVQLFEEKEIAVSEKHIDPLVLEFRRNKLRANVQTEERSN